MPSLSVNAFLVLIAVGLYFVVQYCEITWIPETVKTATEHKKKEKAPETLEEELLARGKHVVFQHCSSNQECYFVHDEAFYETPTSLIVHRRLYNRNDPSFALAECELITPELTKESLDTRKWDVTHAVLPHKDLRMLTAAPLMLQSILTEDNTKGSLLLLGHNGGAIAMMYFNLEMGLDITAVDPNEDIIEMSQYWFKFDESEKNSVVHSDMDKYLVGQIAKGAKQTAILMDHCKAIGATTECPPRELFTEDFISHLATSLVYKGTLAIRLHLPSESDERELLSKLNKEFNTCFLLQFAPERRILICTHQKQHSWKEKRKTYISMLKKIDEYYKFKLSPYFIDTVSKNE